jgi:hypothetical protein
MVLPLPLVPFESYMLADDRPAYPMNMFLRLRFTGRFDRTALDKALSIAVSHHPLLAAVVRRSGRRTVWMAADHVPGVCWLTTPPAESLPSLAPLDVRVEAGLRVVSCEDAGRTDITIQAHHACCDGLGILGFAEDLLISYAKVCGVAPALRLHALQPERLPGRGRFGLTAGTLLRRLPQQARGLLGAWRFLVRTPEPLIPHQPHPAGGAVPVDYPASLTRQLTRAEWAGLVRASRRLRVTTNDLLVRDFFLSVNDWRLRAGVDGCGWLRLAVPISLRTLADRRLPAANVVSMVFLDRRGGDMEDPQRLLDSVHQRMSLVKRLQLGLTFVLSLGVCQWLPGGLGRRTRMGLCMATAVLTNLGTVAGHCPLAHEDDQLVVGEAVLRSVDGLAPLRPLTCVAVALLLYAGRLHITLHYDSRVLAATNACRLIDDFTARVRESAEVREPRRAEVRR